MTDPEKDRTRPNRNPIRIAVLAAALVASQTASAWAEARAMTVFAAASVKNALDEAAKAFTAATGVEAKLSYAASFTLARQIDAGAPAEVFLSADAASMNYLAERALIDKATRTDLLGNSLVLVAPASDALGPLAFSAQAFLAALGGGRLAMGDPASVPAGTYARAAFEALGLWTIVQPRAAFADTVRGALQFVARGEAPLGAVYATDALIEPRVKVVATIPEKAHPKIVYPLAATTRAGDSARRFIAFLQGATARAIFEKQGFVFLPR